MTKIIAIVNPRGGVGKTATAINLGVALALSWKKTLIIDLDPNRNASTGLGLDNNLFNDRTIYHVLNGSNDIKKSIYETNYNNLQIIPGDFHLADLNTNFAEKNKSIFKLKEELEELKGRYDFILLDCSPSMGGLTKSALVACHSYLIPVQCSYRDMEIVDLLLGEVEKIKATLNPIVYCQGILLTMVNRENNFSCEIKNSFKGIHIFQTEIPQSIELSESCSGGKDLFQCAPDSAAAMAYQTFALRDFVTT